MKRILFVALCALAIPSVFAVNPVTVNGAGGGDFLTIQDAITSWASGEANAGETPPFVINVVPGNGNGVGGAYRERITLNDAFASGEIMGDLVIQSSVPGTYVGVELQQELSGGTAGIPIYQDGESITFRDLQIFPSIVAPTLTGYWIRYDENTGTTGAANTITFDNCLFTQIDTGTGAPLVSSRAEIYTAPKPTATAGTRQLHLYADAGEPVDYVLTDTCFYGAGDYAVICYMTDPGDSLTVTNCLWGISSIHQLRFSGNSTGGATALITGTDQTAGPDNCTMFLQQWNGDNHACYHLTGVGNTALIEKTIIAVVGPDLGAAGTDTRPISGSGTWELDLADVLIYNEGTGAIVDGITASAEETWDRVTFVNPRFFLVGGTNGAITVRDSIFAGAGSTVWGGTAPTNGIDVDYCAYVENGPDAIASRGTVTGTLTDGVNIITADPVFISMDPLSADFLDVDNSQYAGRGTAGSNLAGGGDFVGGGVPVELSIFSTN